MNKKPLVLYTNNSIKRKVTTAFASEINGEAWNFLKQNIL